MKFKDAPIGSRFVDKHFPIYMKIERCFEEIDGVYWLRNGVVIDGEDKGKLGLWPDDDEMEDGME